MNYIVFRNLASAHGAKRRARSESWRERLKAVLETSWFGQAVATVIVINAITLGLETWPAAMVAAGQVLTTLDRIALILFSVEIAAKIAVYRGAFFRGGWNLFDLVVVGIAWVPSAGALSVLRTLRVLRVLRLVSAVPQMRAVVGALFNALPGMGSIIAVLLLLFYVAAVVTTKLFGASFPEWFGSVGASMYSLFQIMTLESWSMGIVRPVMSEYPHAWLFFVPFVVITSFAVLNLFIALIVNSLQHVSVKEQERARTADAFACSECECLLEEIRALRQEVRQISSR